MLLPAARTCRPWDGLIGTRAKKRKPRCTRRGFPVAWERRDCLRALLIAPRAADCDSNAPEREEADREYDKAMALLRAVRW